MRQFGNKMKMVICSKGRCGKISVIPKLLSGFHKSDVILFIEPQEFSKYKQEYSDVATIVNIGKNNQGLGFGRWFVQMWCEQHGVHFAWLIDDDVYNIAKRSKPDSKGKWTMSNITDPNDLVNVFVEIANTAFENRWSQIGISFKASNHYQPKLLVDSYRNWAIVCNNISMLARHNCRYDKDQFFFSDFAFICEQSVKRLISGATFKYAFDVPPMNSVPGGCNLTRTHELTLKYCKRLRDKFGGQFVKIYFHKQHNIYEMKIQWRKLREYYSFTRGGLKTSESASRLRF